MRTLLMAVICLALASLALGQIQSDTFTVQATRSAALTPDQVVFDVIVTAVATTSFDQVLTALQGLGITAVNLSGTSFVNRDSLDWSFSVAVQFAKMKATVASLTSLQQSISKDNSGLKLSFYVRGSTVSPELQSQPCPTNDLIADAQAQAQKMASAAGFTVGPIVSVSKPNFAEIFDPSTAAITGTFSFSGLPPGLISVVPNAWFAAPAPVSNCTAEVRFTLLRYR